jgi:hypothetical protein
MRRVLMMVALGTMLAGCDSRVVTRPSALAPGASDGDLVQLGGHYSLRFEADPGCRTLPSEARTRVYSGLLANAPSFMVHLQRAPFGPGFQGGSPGITMNVVSASLVRDYFSMSFSNPPIREAGAYPFFIDGFARGVVVGQSFTLPLSGTFGYGDVFCRSDRHRLTLLRN